jgi:hypothetical protein
VHSNAVPIDTKREVDRHSAENVSIHNVIAYGVSELGYFVC